MNDRQRRFVEEYLIDLNATQAYVRAGYSPKGANKLSARLMANDGVAEAIQAAQAERSKRTEITQDVVLQEIAVLLRSDVRHFEVDSETGQLQLAKDAPDSAWRAVSSVKHRTIITGRGEDAEVRREIEFRLWDKPAAARMAGQHLGMFKERFEHSGPDGAPIPVAVEDVRGKLADRLSGLASRITVPATNGNGNGRHA